MLRASRNKRAARKCTHFCAELIRACAVLTKFLIYLNKRGGFHRCVLARSACCSDENAAFAGAKSQIIASRRLSQTVLLHHPRMQTCKKCAFADCQSRKTNNEAMRYANCKMPAKAILQVFKMLLQNAKYCANFTKSKTRFCEKRLIFSAI